MTINYSKYAASLHHETQNEIVARVSNSTKSPSWWVDSMLTRYLTLLETARPTIRDEFTPEDLKLIGTVLKPHTLAMRNMSVRGLKILIKTLRADDLLPLELHNKIKRLNDSEFLCLLDMSERDGAPKADKPRRQRKTAS